MKNTLIALAVLAPLLAAGTAMANSVDGRLGVSGYLGFQIPSNGTDNVDGVKLETEVSFTGGGGIIYGIGRSIAAEVEVTHSIMDVNQDLTDMKFETTNLDVGLQYRLMAEQKLVPYVGAGVTILFARLNESNDTGHDIDTAYAGHVKLGLDYFVNPHIALSAGVKQVIGSTVNIKDASGTPEGKFNPSGFHSLFGLKYFF